ncbi:MAG: SDR family oxidoreductase [Phycisphaeraceae bacterium]|jgi:3-oxoacyl-[acyl-carrier protein] reductase|nr:SDR family oxidoreductase [Phycisphaeraceae bacterium]MDP7346728.1 SDR family oxidoreductase [Phycisphaeraceae bacterium]
MNTDLTGRTALITGGGTGIGAAIAKGYAADGANVIVNYSRSAKEAHDTVDEIIRRGGAAIAIQCDVSQADQVDAMFAKARDTFGRIDILVNNAGQVSSKDSTAEMSEAMWDRTIAVNLKSVFLCSRAAIPQLPDKIGRIINVTSMSALSGRGGPAYGPAKAGANALTRDMAFELAPRGITVNAIAPGIIDTRIHQIGTPPDDYAKLMERIPMGRDGKVEELVGLALLLASDAGSFITGEVVQINGGMLMH